MTEDYNIIFFSLLYLLYFILLFSFLFHLNFLVIIYLFPLSAHFTYHPLFALSPTLFLSLINSLLPSQVPIPVIHVDRYSHPPCQLSVRHEESSVASCKRWKRKPHFILVSHSLYMLPVATKPINGK